MEKLSPIYNWDAMFNAKCKAIEQIIALKKKSGMPYVEAELITLFADKNITDEKIAAAQAKIANVIGDLKRIQFLQNYIRLLEARMEKEHAKYAAICNQSGHRISC